MVAQPASAPASAPPTGGGVLESLGAEVLQDLGLVALALIVAYLLSAVLTLGAKRLTARTTTDLDDAVIAELRPAVSLGLFALGVWVALGHIELRGQIEYLVMAAIATAVAVISGRSVFRSVILVLREFGRPDRVRRRVPQRLIPLIEYTAQIGVWLLVLHAILVAWDVEAVLLQTMSGTLGLAVGLAAEGSLSNVISGLFIHADRSCRVGDYLQLDEGHRGRVTHIGLRSVRVLTDDHVEINIPNTVVGSARVVNETAGPGDDMRLRTEFVVRLGTDIDLIRRVAAELPRRPPLSPHIAPEFRVLAVNDRGIRVAVYFWLGDLTKRVPAFDMVNSWLYERLTAEGVSFAHLQHVVHVDAAQAVLSALGRPGGS